MNVLALLAFAACSSEIKENNANANDELISEEEEEADGTLVGTPLIKDKAIVSTETGTLLLVPQTVSGAKLEATFLIGNYDNGYARITLLQKP